MPRLGLSFLLAFTWAVTFAQSSITIEWQRCIGGSLADELRSTKQTTDGGYIIAGETSSIDGDISGNHGQYDALVVKLDSTGNLQWQKCFGGSLIEFGRSIQQTFDGGYILAAFTTSNDGDVQEYIGTGDCWIVKLDPIGAIEWQHTFGGTTHNEHPECIRQTDDGGYVFVGMARSADGHITDPLGQHDVWVVRLGQNGDLVWQRSLGGSDYDWGHTIEQTSDGGYILAGQTGSNDHDVSGHHGGVSDGWVVKLDGSGTIEWQKCLGGSGFDLLGSIEQTSDGGYITAGLTNSSDGDVQENNGSSDLWVIKLDANGGIQWQRTYGGASVDEAFDVSQAVDGGYYVTGKAHSSDGDVSNNLGSSDLWLIKLDAGGNMEWERNFGGSQGDMGYVVFPASNGGLVVGGRTDSVDGDISGCNEGSDIWVVKFGNIASALQDIGASRVQMFPNPTTGQLNIQLASDETGSITLHDALGRQLLQRSFNGRHHQLDLSDQPKGFYLVTLQTEQGISTQRLVLE